MKLKQIAFATSLLCCSHLVLGATYDVQFETSKPFDLTDNYLTTPDTPSSQEQINQLKEDYLKVIALLKNGNLELADKKIDNLIRQYPQESNFYNLRATAEIFRKEYPQAIKSYQKAIQLSPKNIRSHLGLAAAYLQSGDYSKAKRAANKGLSLDNNSIQAYFILAEVAYKEDKLQDAENFLLTAQKKARKLRTQEVNASNKLTTFYILQKQPEKALATAQDIVKRYPKNNSALNLLAKVQIYKKENEQAIVTLEKLIEQETKDTSHYLLLAKLLLNKPGKEQQILKLLDKVTVIAPNNTKVRVQKANILIKLKAFPAALQESKKIKQLAPNTGIAEALEGDVYLAEKKNQQALTSFQQSYQLTPRPKVMELIFKILMTQEKQADAINFLNQELKKDPKNTTAHFILGNIAQQQNKTREAKKHYLAILAEQPNNVIILNNLAWIYHQENNPKALSLAEKAYQIVPNSAEIADTYAVILIHQGNTIKGLKILDQASKLAPQNYDIQYHIAEAYALKGQSQQAIKILNSITRSEQEFPEKEAAIKLLKTLE